jgi:hypothetical protein
MHLLAVGDLHGNNCWKEIDVSRYDHIIFIGDYVDSFYHTDNEIVSNLNSLITLKEQFPEKIVLLLGNHDIQYLYYPRYRCSGFNTRLQPVLSELFRRYTGWWLFAWQYKRFLFTHAGLSNAYFNWLCEQLQNRFTGEKMAGLANNLNRLPFFSAEELLFTVSKIRGGNDPHGGPLWADLSETMNDPLQNYRQVAGHTPTPNIMTHKVNPQTSITYIDVLEQEQTFYDIFTPD